MARGVSGGTFAAALLALALGSGLIWLATWLAPLTAADLAVKDGRLTDGLNAFRTAESRLSQVPALQQLAPGILGSVQANQVRLLYQMQRYDEAIEKAGDSTSVYGTHFFVDPVEQVVGVLLVQTSIQEMNRDFEDLVAQSIID